MVRKSESLANTAATSTKSCSLLFYSYYKEDDKGRTIRYLRGGWAIFLCTNFFLSPNCLQEFFFLQRSFARYFF